MLFQVAWDISLFSTGIMIHREVSISASFFLKHSLSLSLSLTHTHTHTHTHTRTHARTHTRTHTHRVEGNGHFFPSYRQLYLSSFSDTHTLSLSLSCSFSQKQRGQWSCLSLDTTTGMSTDRVCHITHVQYTTISVYRQVGSSLFWVSWCSTNHQSNISVHSNSGNEQSCIVQ